MEERTVSCIAYIILIYSFSVCVIKILFNRLLDLQHHNEWSESLDISEQILHVEEHENGSENCSQLSSLNLAHNQFTAIPVVLSCLAVNLTRLNLAYNK